MTHFLFQNKLTFIFHATHNINTVLESILFLLFVSKVWESHCGHLSIIIPIQILFTLCPLDKLTEKYTNKM